MTFELQRSPDSQVLRRRRGPPRCGPRRRRRFRARPAGRERGRQVHPGQDHRRRLPGRRRRGRGRRHQLRGLTPRQARDLGVAIIFQEFQDASTLTVAENISLGRIPNRRGLVSWRAMRERARAILDQLDVDIDPDATVGTLRVGERQIVEIARSLSGSARLLILDEPTAALSHHEAEVLFDFIRRLREQGVAIIYITHRLDEVTQVADRVQVLRDGSTSLLTEVRTTDRRAMIEAMIGRRMAEVGRPPRPAPAAPSRRCAGEAGTWAGLRERRPGGLPGRGRGPLRQARIGCRRGRRVGLRHPPPRPPARSTCRAWCRRFEAAGCKPSTPASVSCPPIARPAVPSWSALSPRTWPSPTGPTCRAPGIISERVEAKAFGRWRERLGIRSRNDPKQTMGTLSGGNQQKVLLARWLERDSRALVLIEPTRGVDVGAREDIYRSLRDLAGARRGRAGR